MTKRDDLPNSAAANALLCACLSAGNGTGEGTKTDLGDGWVTTEWTINPLCALHGNPAYWGARKGIR